jgi:3-hydroxyisobutyrate dehydrogenase-like beta-hydroxyacid dehydrogenase
VAASPEQVGAESELVGICVFSDEDVEDVILRDDGVLQGMTPGGVIAIHSTVLPDTVTRIAARASEHQVAVLDAPVSGGGEAAAARKLLLLAGGEAAEVTRCRPVFETFANPVVHLGPLGSGQIAKAINNLLLAAHMAMAYDAFDFARVLGLDLPALAEALAAGTGGSAAVGIFAGARFDVGFLRKNSARYFSKDLEIMLEIAQSRGMHTPDSLVDMARGAFDPAEA